MPNNRDNFTPATKRLLAERAAWRCGYPGCTTSTIGPSEADGSRSITLGEAAHITGAAPGGARYDGRLTEDERRDATNGIWMCRHHARLVDADENNYSVQTLRLWKAEAERLAAEELKSGVRATAVTPSTLVMLGFNHVFHAHWIKGGNGEWQFDCRGFVRGDERTLIDELENFGTMLALDRFVVVESQGDGRMLAGPPRWERNSGVLRVILPVHLRSPRTDPSQLGADLALGDDGDLVIENGDLALVSGERNAIQQLSLAASILFGAWVLDERAGSLCTLYFHHYRDDPDLLGRLFRLEFARLATIPDDVGATDAPLSFVWRVDEVRIDASHLREGRMPVAVSLEWADRTHWSGSIVINILAVEDLAKFPRRIRR